MLKMRAAGWTEADIDELVQSGTPSSRPGGRAARRSVAPRAAAAAAGGAAAAAAPSHAPVEAPAPRPSPQLLQGWLLKRGHGEFDPLRLKFGGRGWQRRFFVLTPSRDGLEPSVVFYFKRKPRGGGATLEELMAAKPSGCLVLDSRKCKATRVPQLDGSECDDLGRVDFTVTNPHDYRRSLMLKAKSARERDAWLEAFATAVQMACSGARAARRRDAARAGRARARGRRDQGDREARRPLRADDAKADRDEHQKTEPPRAARRRRPGGAPAADAAKRAARRRVRIRSARAPRDAARRERPRTSRSPTTRRPRRRPAEAADAAAGRRRRHRRRCDVGRAYARVRGTYRSWAPKSEGSYARARREARPAQILDRGGGDAAATAGRRARAAARCCWPRRGRRPRPIRSRRRSRKSVAAAAAPRARRPRRRPHRRPRSRGRRRRRRNSATRGASCSRACSRSRRRTSRACSTARSARTTRKRTASPPPRASATTTSRSTRPCSRRSRARARRPRRTTAPATGEAAGRAKAMRRRSSRTRSGGLCAYESSFGMQALQGERRPAGLELEREITRAYDTGSSMARSLWEAALARALARARNIPDGAVGHRGKSVPVGRIRTPLDTPS